MNRILGKQRADGLWAPVGITDAQGIVRPASQDCRGRCCGGDWCCCMCYYELVSFENSTSYERHVFASVGEYVETVSERVVAIEPPGVTPYLPRPATIRLDTTSTYPLNPINSSVFVPSHIVFGQDFAYEGYQPLNGCYGWAMAVKDTGGFLRFRDPLAQLLASSSQVCEAGGHLDFSGRLFDYPASGAQATGEAEYTLDIDEEGVRVLYDTHSSGAGPDYSYDAAYHLAFELRRLTPCWIPPNLPTWPLVPASDECHRCPEAVTLPPFDNFLLQEDDPRRFL